MNKFFKVVSPNDRFEFFQNTIKLFILQLILGVTFWILTTYTGVKNFLWLTPLFLIFIEIPMLYLYFVQLARRVWSVLGVFKLSIFLSIILFMVSVVGFIYVPILVVLIYLLLLLAPERDINE